MRTTLNLNAELLEEAMELSGHSEKTRLIHEALRALIAKEAAKRLALLGGTEPDAQSVPRRSRQRHTT